MGFFGRLIGIEDEQDRSRTRHESGYAPRAIVRTEGVGEEQALERYRYMLRTAPPETLEQAHAEAFAKLRPEQRRQVLAELTNAAPASERPAVAQTASEDPRALAQVATRAEIRQPGLLERTLGGGGMGMGASLLSSFAMGFVGSMVAQSFLSAVGGFGGGAEPEPVAENDAPAEDEAAFEDNGDYADEDFDV